MGGWYFSTSKSLIWTNSSGVIMAFASIACAIISVEWYSFSLRNNASFTGDTFLRPKPRTDIAGVGAILPIGVTIRLKCTPTAQTVVAIFLLVAQMLWVLVPPSQPADIRTKPAVSASLGVVQRGTALRTHVRHLIRYRWNSYTSEVVALAVFLDAVFC